MAAQTTQKAKTSKLFNIRLSEAEYASLERIRQQHKVPISQLFKEMIPFLLDFYKSEK